MNRVKTSAILLLMASLIWLLNIILTEFSITKFLAFAFLLIASIIQFRENETK